MSTHSEQESSIPDGGNVSHHALGGFLKRRSIFRFQMGTRKKKKKNLLNLRGSGDNEEVKF